MTGPIKAWLELMRLSNLPTVWANTLHGLATGLYVAWSATPPSSRPESLPTGIGFYTDQGFVLLVAVSLIYMAGMIFNDVADVGEDTLDRPGRPIPRGAVGRKAAAAVAGVLGVVGVLLAGVYRQPQVQWCAIALLSCVIIYDFVQPRRLTGWVLLPLCRVLAFVAGAFAFAGSTLYHFPVSLHVALPVLALAAYTLGITLLARHETRVAGRPQRVGRMIAAMPLFDAAFLLALGLYAPLALACVACAGLTLVGQRWIRGS